MRVGLLPAVLDLDLYVGDGFGLEFSFVDKDSGDPYPLTGTFSAQVRHLDELVTAFSIDTTDAATGVLTLGLTPVQTELIVSGSVWDLQQTPTVGVVRTWYRGTIRMFGDVTS
jgi:hypothetical protein